MTFTVDDESQATGTRIYSTQERKSYTYVGPLDSSSPQSYIFRLSWDATGLSSTTHLNTLHTKPKNFAGCSELLLVSQHRQHSCSPPNHNFQPLERISNYFFFPFYLLAISTICSTIDGAGLTFLVSSVQTPSCATFITVYSYSFCDLALSPGRSMSFYRT